MAKASQEPQVVAPRVDPVETAVDGAPRTDILEGRDPNFHYEWASSDPDHPGFAGNRLKGRQLANGTRVGPWQVVVEDENGVEAPKPMRRFADDGEGIDGVVRNRRDVLMAIPKAEYAKYAEEDKFLQKPLDDQIHKGDVKHYGGGADSGGVTNTAGFRQLGIPQR